jgi:hypothetical protein
MEAQVTAGSIVSLSLIGRPGAVGEEEPGLSRSPVQILNPPFRLQVGYLPKITLSGRQIRVSENDLAHNLDRHT